MKLIFKYSCILTLLCWFAACKKDGEMAIIGDTQKGNITASASILPLSKNTETDTVVVFSWKSSGFGNHIAVDNVLQFALKGSNFASPKEVNVENGISQISYTGLALNALASSLGLEFDTPTDIEVRLKSVAEGAVKLAPVYTDAVSLKVTTYPSVSYVYVPGDYQGWDPTSADSLKSAMGNGIYEGVINFGAKVGGSLEFKITTAKKWDIAYGSAGVGIVSKTAGDNLKAPAEYSTKITLNTNNNTIKMDKYSFGMIGSATPDGWNSDTNMNYDNGKDEWFIKINLVPGEMKFRLNDDWGINYGGTNGIASQNGANIAIATAGTYEVRFSVINATYTVIKK